ANWSVNVPLQNGANVITVTARDAAGNASSPASVTITSNAALPPAPPPPIGSTIVDVGVMDATGTTNAELPVTFGQVFKPGDVPAGATLVARVGSTGVELQVDKKATHAD